MLIHPEDKKLIDASWHRETDYIENQVYISLKQAQDDAYELGYKRAKAEVPLVAHLSDIYSSMQRLRREKVIELANAAGDSGDSPVVSLEHATFTLSELQHFANILQDELALIHRPGGSGDEGKAA